MAALSDTERAYLWRRFMEAGNCPGDISKTDLRAAVDALDDWVEVNASSLNSALPQPFRGSATLEQKAIMLAYVALRRAGRDV